MKHAPLIVHGSLVSYFTGKLEGALRYKEISYLLKPMNARAQKHEIPAATGVFQMPAVQLPDGRWLTDSTPIIAWLDKEFPAYPLIPGEPVLRLFCLLLEDYADEWLWRPAMHYRWYYPEGAELLSRKLADELMDDVLLPGFAKRALIRFRQRHFFTRGDGVDEANVRDVEAIYLRTLQSLEAILLQRPYLLGDRPSIVDIGFFGSMFRHFSQDPVPAAIMRASAPATHLWVARLWAAKGSAMGGEWLTDIPADWAPLLDEVGSAYLPYLLANAEAVAAGQKSFDVSIKGVRYRKARSSRYRVWCLERLQAEYHALVPADKQRADEILQRHHCLAALQQPLTVRSGHDPEGVAPFARGATMLGL